MQKCGLLFLKEIAIVDLGQNGSINLSILEDLNEFKVIERLRNVFVFFYVRLINSALLGSRIAPMPTPLPKYR